MISNAPAGPTISAADIKLITGLGTLLEANGTGLGFNGKAPVAQAAAPTAPVATLPTQSSPFGYATQSQASAITNAVIALINAFSAAAGGNGLTA